MQRDENDYPGRASVSKLRECIEIWKPAIYTAEVNARPIGRPDLTTDVFNKVKSVARIGYH